MSKKNALAARREAHERLLERERQQKAKKEAKRLKFQARAPKKMDLEKSGTEKRRAAATEGRKSARQKVIDKRRSMEM